jgi:hypothetical protein
VAGPGFEPGKAVPCGLQPHPFDRSGIPPGPLSLTLDPEISGYVPVLDRRRRARWQRSTSVDFVLRIPRATQQDSASSADCGRRDIPTTPIAHMHEQRVTARGVKDSSPASPCRRGVQANSRRDHTCQPGRKLLQIAPIQLHRTGYEAVEAAGARRTDHEHVVARELGPPRRASSRADYEASRSRCASGRASSFLSVWFSICRIRSRVTLNARPTSSRV